MDLFFIKKIIGVLLMPLPVISALILLSFFALWRKKNTKSLVYIALAGSLTLLTGTPIIADRLLGSLEQKYKQFDMSENVDYIVVLGCGHTNDPRMPITSQLKHCSLARVIEGLRIHQQKPNSIFLTSGSAFSEPFSNAAMGADLLIAMGIDPTIIQQLEAPRDTEDEAIAAKPILSGKRFALVTSASHMQRAIGLFEAQGLHPIAAPTQHLVQHGGGRDLHYYLPHSRHMQKFERWWYEFLGQQWLTIKSTFTH